MTELTIAGLARAGGVGVETIRYYQRRGLLVTPTRPQGSGVTRAIRRYSAADLQRLRFIRSAQASGFTLTQIKELLSLDAGNDRKRARQMARERIQSLEEQIAALKAARRNLEKLAHACAGGHGPCPIIPVLGGS
jgi:MerR family transcriptional regulator, mercuric resistance operon regulatory protein